jgi:hypothetical protein
MHDVMQANLLAATSAKSRKYLEDKLKIYRDDIARYNQEKNQIKTEAEQYAKQQDIYKKHGASFGLAVILLQIAIMLSSMGALLKRQLLWFLGLWGMFNMLNGFFLFV